MYIRKTDANQAEIVKALRKLGCSVHSLHKVGQGVPDLLVGYRGVNYLVEVKAVKGAYTQDQLEWLDKWRARVYTIRSVEEVCDIVSGWNDDG